MKQSIFPSFRGGGQLNPLFLLLLLFGLEPLSAQTAFITEYSSSQLSMTTAQTTRYTALQSDVKNHSVKIVATADVRTKQVNGRLTFVVPGLADTLRTEATLIRDDTSGFVWSGKILNHPGYVSFLIRNGLTSGFIQVGTHFYELLSMGTNYQFLVERTGGTLKECGNPGVAASEEPPGPNYCNYSTGDNAYNTCPALIYMLLVITPAAETWIAQNYGPGDAGIQDFVSEGQNQINLAFANSDIPNKEVTIKWIKKNITTANGGLTGSNDIDQDKPKLPLLVEPERTDNQTDVAFLITDQGYDRAGVVLDIGPNKAKAYGIVEAQYFNTQYSIAHELGHLMGCHHNWGINFGNDNEPVCAHGYRWYEDLGNTTPGQFYTISNSWVTLLGIGEPTEGFVEAGSPSAPYYVQFAPSANVRILNYSNPDVLYNGVPTGVATGYIANNARQIRNGACEVADFFPLQDLSVFVTTSNCAIIPFTYTANISSPASGLPGQGPYTVTWYWNTDGNFSSSFGGGGTQLGTGTSLTVYQHPNYPYCIPYWIKCVVLAADGTQVSRIRKIDLNPDRCFCQAGTPPGDGRDRSTTSSELGAESLRAYPNPVDNGLLNLEKQSLANVEARAAIVDLSGRTLLDLPVHFNADGRAGLATGPLTDGLYLLRLSLHVGTCYNLKFVIAKN